MCLAAALAVPAVALAGLVFPPDNDYQGRIEGDPNTYFGFNTYKRHGKVKRVNRISTAIPVNCYSGDRPIIDVQVPGSFKVIRLRLVNAPKPLRGLKLFEADGERIDTDAGAGTVEAFGVLRSHGRSQGTISVRTHDPDLGRCYSGYLEWRAKKGAEVTLPVAKP